MEQSAQIKKPKVVSLTSSYSQITKKCVKEKRVKTAEEEVLLAEKFKAEFPKSVFKGSEWLYANLSKKYHQQNVYIVDSRQSGGLVKIKKKQPTVKQIVKQMNLEEQGEQIKLDELVTILTRDTLLILETKYSQ